MANAIVQLLASALLVELGFLFYAMITHKGHSTYWSSYGWWVTLAIWALAWVIDSLTDEVADASWFFDVLPEDEPERVEEPERYEQLFVPPDWKFRE